MSAPATALAADTARLLDGIGGVTLLGVRVLRGSLPLDETLCVLDDIAVRSAAEAFYIRWCISTRKAVGPTCAPCSRNCAARPRAAIGS